MSYAIEKENVFLDIRLTEHGKKLLTTGRLKFQNAVLLDREMNYSLEVDGYDISNNSLLLPKDHAPSIKRLVNFDGTPSISLLNKTKYYSRNTTGSTNSGFFIRQSDHSNNGFGRYEIDPKLVIYSGGADAYEATGGTALDINYAFSVPAQVSQSAYTGNLLLVRWNPPTLDNAYGNFSFEYALQTQWYRILDSTTASTPTVTLDRQVPDFRSGDANNRANLWMFPYNGIRDYYGSGTTSATSIWNMNIVRTVTEIGHNTGYTSGFTTYGSIEYNGVKTKIGIDRDVREIGVIHYSNMFSGKTYGDKLFPGTLDLICPTVMWWRKPRKTKDNMFNGHVFTDKGSAVLYDGIARTRYTNIMDGSDRRAITVGRFYYEMGIIIILDPELISALSYKSNRSYALPPLEVGLSSHPAPPNTVNSTTGACVVNKSYLVTYIVEDARPFKAGLGLGYQPILHCGYIKKIDAPVDADRRNYYIKSNLTSNSLPYTRNTGDMNASSGTGWTVKQFNILVKEIDTSGFTGMNNVEYSGWTKMIQNGGASGMTNGAIELLSKQFILDRSDIDNGETYELFSGITSNSDIQSGGLSLGSESFFFGNVSLTHAFMDHYLSITLNMGPNEFNSSKNSTFNSSINESTYITEVCFYNERNELIATAKPTNPISKNPSRNVVLQMELAF